MSNSDPTKFNTATMWVSNVTQRPKPRVLLGGAETSKSGVWWEEMRWLAPAPSSSLFASSACIPATTRSLTTSPKAAVQATRDWHFWSHEPDKSYFLISWFCQVLRHSDGNLAKIQTHLSLLGWPLFWCRNNCGPNYLYLTQATVMAPYCTRSLKEKMSSLKNAYGEIVNFIKSQPLSTRLCFFNSTWWNGKYM